MENAIKARINLERCLNDEINSLNQRIKQNLSIQLFIDTIRAIDFYFIASYENKEEFDTYIKYGFAKFLKQLYIHSDFANLNDPLAYNSNNHGLNFCHYYLVTYGKCRTIERYLGLVGAGLVELVEEKASNFKIILKGEYSLEYKENVYITNYFKIFEKTNFSKIKTLEDKKADIIELLSKSINLKLDNTLEYLHGDEINNYYYDNAEIHLNRTQLYDDFEKTFEFGGIIYQNYLDVLKFIIGFAIKHIDSCMILYKRNPNYLIFNSLSIFDFSNKILEECSNFLDLEITKVNSIFETLTVSANNIETHLKDDRSFSPIFIKMGEKVTIGSVKGCLYFPTIFLHYELKRKFTKDYMRWINEREITFRTQLYSIFDEQVIKILRNITLKNTDFHTDIDAVLFDPRAKSLGLFQLKWQDKYSSDISERTSRIKNFYPKANEWVQKISKWISSTSHKSILNAVNIEESQISEIYLFVIGRYNTHFSQEEIDQRASWGSWYHVVSIANETGKDDPNPIRTLHNKLKTDSPRHKIDNLNIANYKIEFSNFKVTFSNPN